MLSSGSTGVYGKASSDRDVLLVPVPGRAHERYTFHKISPAPAAVSRTTLLIDQGS